MTNDQFAAALRRLGMKQKEFAAKAGVTPEAVNRWCKGGKPVPVWAAWLVSELLDRLVLDPSLDG
jgi:transcriptional regulator with XRE-family HTH domain